MSDKIACPISRIAAVDPDRIALIEDRNRLTYREYDQKIDMASTALSERGVTAGDTVAVLMSNSISFAVLLFAAFRLGFKMMPLNHRLGYAELRKQLREAGCEILICDRITDLDKLNGFSVMEFDHFFSDNITKNRPDSSNEFSLNRPGLIIYTSGSCGRPRGAVLSWENLYYSALGTATVIDLKKKDRWMAVLPFYHIGGLAILFRTALAGSVTEIFNRFDRRRVLKRLSESITENREQDYYISLTPEMLGELIDNDKDNNLGEFKAIIVGGAKFGPLIRNQVVARRLKVLTTYGMTETSSMVTLLNPNDSPDHLDTSGRLLPNREMKIDAEGGQTGRILVRGKTLFLHYTDIKGGGEKRLPEDWFDTGDLGKIDDRGFLSVTGRSQRMIISGGENIDLNFVENILRQVSSVRTVVVLGRDDRKWGERPVAFVEMSDKEKSERYLKGELEGRIPRFMMPDRIIKVEIMPLTESGKIDHLKIRKDYASIFDIQD